MTTVTASHHNEAESTQLECQPNHSHLLRMPSTNVFSGRTNAESILCVLCVSMHSVRHFVPSFPVLDYWHETSATCC